MATEGFLLHDGAQNVAAADYSSTANLGGMKTNGLATGTAGGGGSGQFLAVAISLVTGRTVVLCSVAGQKFYGILQNKPKLGEAADVGVFGITKAVVGATGSTLGKPQMVDAAGAVCDWTATGNKFQIGYALETGVTGQVITMTIGSTGNTVA
jgi:hypothetical protein